MNRDQIKSVIAEHGHEGFVNMFNTLVEGKHILPNGLPAKLKLDNLSIRAIWEGCVGPLERTFGVNRFDFIKEAGAPLDATAFPSVTEKLLSTVVIESYNARPGIADELVPANVRPNTLTERIVGFTMPEASKSIMPGEVYPTSGFGEKYVTFEEALFNKQEGLEIQVTEE